MANIQNSNIEVDEQSVVYEGFPFISNIDTYVQNELTYRSKRRNRAITPYIKVTPGFSPDSLVSSKIVMKGIESPNDKDPSTYKFNELYRPDMFYRPLAGVKSVTVDYKNAYGSTRKATISWVCHTVDDLERLSPYFLNPGYMVLIEWGWSDMAASVTNNDPQIKLDNAFRYGKARQRYTNGNYDCMLGVTTNYSFTINRDGGFDCTTEVISAGYLMEGMTIPNQFTTDSTDARKRYWMSQGKSEEEADRQVQSEENASQVTEETRMHTLQYFLKERLYIQIAEDGNIYNNKNTKDDYFIYTVEGTDVQAEKYLSKDLDDKKTAEYTQETKELQTNFIQKEVWGITSVDMKHLLTHGGFKIGPKMVDTDQVNPIKETKEVTRKKVIEVTIRPAVYATWGYIEDKILNPHIKLTTVNPKKNYFEFNSKKSRMAIHSNLRTTDLSVCLLPLYNVGAEQPLPVPDFTRGEVNNETYNFGYIRRVLINVDWFREIMLGATTVLEGVLQVWAGVNDACINYWNFKLKTNDQSYDDTGQSAPENTDEQTVSEPQSEKKLDIFTRQMLQNKNHSFIERPMSPRHVSDADIETAINRYSIIDVNYADKVVDNVDGNIYIFRTKSFPIQGEPDKFTSIVRSMNFQSKLSSQVALNVFYSAQNSDGKVMGSPQTNTFRSLYDYSIGGKICNISKDTFSMHPLKIDAPKTVDDKENREPGTTDEVELQAQAPYGHILRAFLPMETKGYWVEVAQTDEKKINLTGIEGMKIAVLLGDPPHPNISTATALVPLDCDVELEGISGLRIGNVFTMDHLPKIYQDKGVFQIIGITETVDKNSWVTKIKSQFRVFNDVKYQPLAAVANSTRTSADIPIGNVTADELELYNKKQIDFKTQNEADDFAQLSTKNPRLREVLLNANAYSMKYFKKVITVTDIKRESNETIAKTSSKHLTWQAADLRSSKYTEAELVNFKAWLETQADSVIYHFGTGWHFHITVLKG